MTDIEKTDLARSLHQLIVRVVPGVTYYSKYGGVLYTIKPKEKESQFCGVFICDDHLQLRFPQGARLRDGTGVLLGQGKTRRHINYYSADELKVDQVSRFVRQASKKS